MPEKNESWIDFDLWEYAFPVHLERKVIVIKYFNRNQKPVFFSADINAVDAVVLSFDELRLTAAGAVVKLKILDDRDMRRAKDVIDAVYGIRGEAKAFTRDYLFNKPYLIDKRKPVEKQKETGS